MPSTTQRGGGGASFEPSEYADDFDVDPARILTRNEELVLARIRGTVDQELLDAYLQIEIDRQSRSDVIGAINKRKQELDECPRGCDEPIIDRLVSTAEIKLNHDNPTENRTCIIPTMIDGKPGVEIVYHDTAEQAENPNPAPSPEQETADEDEMESDEADSEEGDDSPDQPVGQRPKQMFTKMRTVDGTMNLSGIQGWAANEMGLSPDETEHVINTLVNGGYIEEVEEGVYAVDTEGE